MIKCSTFRHNFSITFTKQQHYTVLVSLANYQEPFQTLIFQQNFWRGVVVTKAILVLNTLFTSKKTKLFYFGDIFSILEELIF